MPCWPRILALLLTACGSSTPTAHQPANPGASIEWVPWSAEAFERARAENRMVLVDVGIEGCTACRWMYEDTYRNAAVVERMNAHFVAIAVDADLRPDLGERYSAWGWPATIVLTPDGTQVHAIRGNLRPRNFIPVLDGLIRRHREGTLEADANTPIALGGPDQGELGELCTAAVGRIDRSADLERGGFGRRMRGANAAPFRWELARSRARGEAAREEFVARSLDGYARMIDPVWGGIFVAAGPTFTGPIPEKRTIHQGPMMAAFAELHLATGEGRFAEGALAIERYLREWMRTPEGTYYATQEDVAPNLPRGMGAREYYELDDATRREHGIPPIDHGVYTDLNALVIEGYVRLHEATRDDAHLAAAVTAADALLRTRQRDDGLMAQTTPNDAALADERMRAFDISERVYLEPQAPFGLALLALHSATGEARWLDAARRIAEGLGRIEDGERGGFFASDDTSTAGIVPRRRPYGENIAVARFLLRLSWTLRDDVLRARAERTLRAVSPRERLERMGARANGLARVLEELLDGPVEFTVLGTAGDDAARALFVAGVHVYEPRKIVHYEAPGVRYPDQGHAAMFICTTQACSSPITDPAEVPAIAERMARVGEPFACPTPRLDRGQAPTL